MTVTALEAAVFAMAPPSTRRHPLPWLTIACVLLASAAIGPGTYTPWVTPVLGFWLAVVLPTQLLCTKVDWRTRAITERISYSLATTLVSLMAAGLLINAVLPQLGVERPLSRLPVLLTVDALCLALLLWRPERRQPRIRAVLSPLTGVDWLVLAWGAILVLLVVMGANRLNNGAGGGLTLIALCAAAAFLILLFIRRHTLSPGTIIVAIYLVGLALLLMTSLRGWYVTGHDVQRELRVFELTQFYGNWKMSRFPDAYHACLSITILPTMLQRLIPVTDPYLYKVVFQLLFAICPVMVYQITRRFAGTSVALLASVYFIGFPTYFTDMPFLIRQQIAYILVGAIILLATHSAMSVGQRRAWIAVLSVGVVLAHYSTTYLLCAVLILAWAGQRVVSYAVAAHARRSSANLPKHRIPPKPVQAPVLGLLSITVLVSTAFLWNTVITDTSGGLTRTLTRAADTVLGSGQATSSSDVKYSLFAPEQPSRQDRVASYAERAAEHARQTGPANHYPSLARYGTPVVEPANMPLTGVGRALDVVGVNVYLTNWLIRQSAAKFLQLFVLVGLAAALVRFRRLRVSREYYALGLASLFVVLLQVLLPGISADYGVLRSFQQSLFMFAPFLAVGSMTIFARFDSAWEARAAGAVCVAFFVSLTGVVPQLTGGYPPQLHLNNNGLYYDIYYLHPEEDAAISWLRRTARPSALPGVQSEVQTDRYIFTGISSYTGVDTWNDIFPGLVRRDSFVFLGYRTTRTHESTFSFDGDLITYRYPKEFLDATKNRIYCSAGAQVYR
ncbi:MAG TPA: DUF2206 domain-containing protein [Micromonosporaceae bacterium]|nr:DUF2206 domain-containing protein [Micromonosporaceae bacterium]